MLILSVEKRVIWVLRVILLKKNKLTYTSRQNSAPALFLCYYACIKFITEWRYNNKKRGTIGTFFEIYFSMELIYLLRIY